MQGTMHGVGTLVVFEESVSVQLSFRLLQLLLQLFVVPRSVAALTAWHKLLLSQKHKTPLVSCFLRLPVSFLAERSHRGPLQQKAQQLHNKRHF